MPGHDIHHAFIAWARTQLSERQRPLFDRMAARSGIGHRWSILPPGADGVALVPEARATQGIIPAHSVASNMVMAVLDSLSTAGMVDQAKANALTDQMIQRLAVKTASRDHAVSTLSGGNQQKVVIGKWLATDPEILVLDEPTAGIDIGPSQRL